MKKILLVITLLVFPMVILAQDCPRPISGGGSSYVTPSDPGRGCTAWDGNTCNSDRKIGIRFQFYKINSKTDIQLKGYFDVWDSLPMANARISKPGQNTLKNKINCTKVASLTAARTKREGHLLPADLNNDGYISDSEMQTVVQNYVDDAYGNTYFDSTLKTAFNNGTMATWAFYYEGETPISGYLYTYFFKPILDGYYDEAAALFGMSRRDLDEMSKDPDKYYITAEVMYGHTDAHVGTPYYLMPVSESGYTHGAEDKYVAIITTPQDVNTVGLIPNYINKVSATGIHRYMNYGHGYANDSYAYLATCNNAYGFEAWNIRDVCPPCTTTPTCEVDCGDYDSDSAERLACATSWCAINDSGNSSCVSSCTNPIPDDSGCLPGETDGKQCSDYKAGRDNNSSKTLDCEETSQSIINNKTHLSSRVCYDDDTDFDDGTTTDLGTTDFDYGTKFYKIVCDTTFDFKDLPGKQYIYLSKEQPMSIHFSYKVNYKKECTLKYKTSSDKKASIGLWTTNYSNSRLKYDIDALDNAYEETENKMNDPETTAEEKLVYQAVLTNITATKNKLSGIATSASSRLETLSRTETPENILRNDIELVLFDYSTYTEYHPTGPEFELIPVVCEPIDSETLGTRFICLMNKVEEVQYVTIGSTTYECKGEGGQYVYDAAHNKGTYTETLYYTLPDSYIGAHSDNIGPYHTISDCEDAVSEANGFCKVVEYAYVLPPFDGISPTGYASEVAKVGDKLTLKFEAGECNEFSFTYKCDYDFDDTYCEACQGMDKTSEAYKKCLYENCGCEAYCGSDVVCRFLYCPEPCEGCGWGQVLRDDDCQECEKKCSSLQMNAKKYTDCIYDECCYKPCNGNIACEEQCCVSKCKHLYSGNSAAYETCLKEQCPDPPPDKPDDPGKDYLFRSISLYDPFPDRGTKTGLIGNNWYNKERYITDAGEAGQYHDNTSGFGKTDYEYSITINSKQLKQVKKMVEDEKQKIDGVEYNGTTSYKFFKKSNAYTSGKSPYAYCSKFLYEDLANIGVRVKSTEDLYCQKVD